jgi:hypothetical protein
LKFTGTPELTAGKKAAVQLGIKLVEADKFIHSNFIIKGHAETVLGFISESGLFPKFVKKVKEINERAQEIGIHNNKFTIFRLIGEVQSRLVPKCLIYGLPINPNDNAKIASTIDKALDTKYIIPALRGVDSKVKNLLPECKNTVDAINSWKGPNSEIISASDIESLEPKNPGLRKNLEQIAELTGARFA